MRIATPHARAAALLSCAAVALVVAGCGNSDNGSATSATSAGAATPTTGSTAINPAESPQAIVANLRKGTSVPPNATPRPGAKNKNVVIVSQGQANESNLNAVRGSLEACEALGWKCSVLDAKSDPTQYAGIFRQAISQRPDGIIVQAIDCPLLTAPLKEAKAAGIKTVAQQAFDCDDPGIGGEKLYDGVPAFPNPKDPSGEPVSLREYSQDYGRNKAAVILAGVTGKADIISIEAPEVFVLKYIDEGQNNFFKQNDAKVTNVSVRLADLGPKLEAATSDALRKNPAANVVNAPFSAALTLGITSAVDQSGRADKLFVMGVECLTAEQDLVRAGKVAACLYADTNWAGWAGVDGMNSVLTGRPAYNNGIGQVIVDKRNVPAKGASLAEAVNLPDYRADYKKAWGVGGA